MTAVVSRERAKATCLTGAAGVLLLAVAFVMMVVAAPGHAHDPAKPGTLAEARQAGVQQVALDPAPIVLIGVASGVIHPWPATLGTVATCVAVGLSVPVSVWEAVQLKGRSHLA